MFTICPKCALTLLVTAEDLRVAQGYVRCGRCSSVFNALARLTEERQPSEGAPYTATSPPRQSRETSARQGPPPPASRPTESRQGGAPPPPPEGMSDEDSIPEHALEFDPTRTDVSKVFVEPAPSARWSAATGTFKAMMAANQEAVHAPEETSDASPPEPPAGAKPKKPKEPSPSPPPPPPPPTRASSAAQDDDADIDVEIGTEQLASILRAELAPVPPAAPSPAAAGAPSAPPSSTAAAKAPTQPPPPRPRAPSTTARPRARAIEPPRADFAPPPPPPPPAAAPPAASAHAAAPHTPTEDAPPPSYAQVLRVMRPRESSQLVHFLWGAGAVVMLLVLLAQVVNHHRDELAASARFNRPLTALYAALGVRLEPRWDLKAYDVRQLGASVESGGSGLITVRASVKNGAAQPQPLPLLRVTLQDRFGNRIAARDVAPRFYLSGSAPPFLLAGERVDAEMGFVDPGANAVGFEIDACLPASGGVVTCANDNAAR